MTNVTILSLILLITTGFFSVNGDEYSTIRECSGEEVFSDELTSSTNNRNLNYENPFTMELTNANGGKKGEVRYVLLEEVDSNGAVVGNRQIDFTTESDWTLLTEVIEEDTWGAEDTSFCRKGFDCTFSANCGSISLYFGNLFCTRGEWNIPFAGENVYMEKDIHKISYQVGNWPFKNRNNQLRMNVVVKVISTKLCRPSTSLDISSSDNSASFTVSGDETKLVLDLVTKAVVGGRTRSVSISEVQVAEDGVCSHEVGLQIDVPAPKADEENVISYDPTFKLDVYSQTKEDPPETDPAFANFEKTEEFLEEGKDSSSTITASFLHLCVIFLCYFILN